MNDGGDARTLRIRLDQARDALSRRGPTHSGYPCMAAQVFGNPAIPTAAGTYVSVHPCQVYGPEVEGGAPTVTVDTARSLVVYVLGTARPVAGDNLICRFVGNRWVADRFGAAPGGGTVRPGCACPSSPVTITISQLGPDDATPRTVQPCTMAFGPLPAWALPLALAADHNGYLSTSSFVDGSTGDTFYYHLDCYVGFYALTRIYQTSGFGSPFRDLIRYRWTIGAAGNSCAGPWQMHSAGIYAGGNPLTILHADP